MYQKSQTTKLKEYINEKNNSSSPPRHNHLGRNRFRHLLYYHFTMNIIFVTERDCPQVSFTKKKLRDVSFPAYSALDLETTGLIFNKDEVLLVVLGDKDVQYVIDWCSVDKELLFNKMGNISNFIGHNLSFDLPWLISRGLNFYTGQIYDTMETELTLVKGTSHSVSLQNTVKRRLNIDTFDKGITKEFTFMNRNDPFFEDRHIEYAAKDIIYLEDVRVQQENYISKYGQQELTAYNNDMVVVTSYMKVTGMYVDKEQWMKLYYDNLKRADQLEVELDEELNKLGLKQKKRVKQRTLQTDILGGAIDVVNKNTNNINYSSPAQIVDIFRALKQPIPKSAKEDKNSIGTPTLQQYLIDRPDTPLKTFIEKLVTYKDLSKKCNAFGKSWLEDFVDQDSRVRAQFKINRTTTGRLSCSDPNLQQIPADQRYRSCFIGEGDNLIWGADLSGAELKILASLSGDETMLELIRTGKDVHGHGATKVYRYLYNDDTLVVDDKNNKDLRKKMKNVMFALVYGAAPSKIAEILEISKGRGEEVYKILKNTFPQTFEYLEKVASFGVSNGYVTFEKKWNGRRWFPEMFGTYNSSQKSAVERYCKNSPIQGTNAVMIKKAMVDIFKYIEEKNLKSKLIASVHDEILIEVDKDEVEHCDTFEKIMLEASNYFLDGVEMEVESYVEKYWKK